MILHYLTAVTLFIYWFFSAIIPAALKNSILHRDWLYMAIVISFSALSFGVHALLNFPSQKLILLQMSEKLDLCELNTGHGCMYWGSYGLFQCPVCPVKGTYFKCWSKSVSEKHHRLLQLQVNDVNVFLLILLTYDVIYCNAVTIITSPELILSVQNIGLPVSKQDLSKIAPQISVTTAIYEALHILALELKIDHIHLFVCFVKHLVFFSYIMV